MMDRMGGRQLRHWIIKPRFEKKLTIDQQQREEGYQFIRDFGPKANNCNQFMEWTDEQIHTPGGKIENWPEGKVKEALHNYMRGRQNAKTLEFWPFTLKSFTPWFLDSVLTKMIPTMRQHSITWLGRTRTGKSFGSKTVLFMQSKFEIDDADRSDLVPSIVTAKNLDFFKAEPLTRFKPGVFDDGMLQKMDSSFLKAFLNPSEEDATVWARYTSAQFDQGAGRHACNNPYARDLDEKLYMDMKKSKVWQAPHNKFIDMIKPSFAAIDEDEDMDAILARTHIILITDCGIYYRVASTSKDPISFIQWDDNEPMDLMTASQKPIFKQYKMQPHVHNYPASYLEDLAWSQTLIRRLLNGEPVPRGHTVLRPTSLFGSSNARTAVASYPALLPEPELRVKIKKEKVDTAFRSLKGGTVVHTINIDSPSPKKSTASSSDSVMPSSKRAKVTDAAVVGAPSNPVFPTLARDADADEEDVIPEVGQAPDEMEQELERLIDEHDGEMDVEECATTKSRNMVTYADWIAFREAVLAADFLNRTEPFWRHKPFVSYQVNDIVQNALLPSGSPSSMESTDGAVHATVTTDVLYAIAKNIQQQP
ncbi:unnamed protein product [Symbiodinium necroappetens]|uniref:Uncharacterized protein n=1 Tax=Symbiodinium necroappetens TaxID=1628268 RepID=A0A812ZKV6_9DINO|nr:unnamed protein product [Symbiodinium necroappetens]